MSRFKSIVVATDLSSESLGVISYASHLDQDDSARLTIVHVAPSVSLADYSDIVPGRDLDALDQEFLEHARTTLEGWVKRHLGKRSGVDVVVEQGVVDEIVCRVAEDVDADVVVVASHGREGLSRLLLGSIAERVIREAPCPVLVVKPPNPTITVKSEEDGSPDKETHGVSR
jgi:nucleotide-binding universal stress UspA family protein